jgi:exodeoxyribonuclease-5
VTPKDIKALEATGLKVLIIDEDTDFSMLESPDFGPPGPAAKPSRFDLLTDEQKLALQEIELWINTKPAKKFVLKGFAGTGKTFVTQALADRIKGRVVFTAPTNKATRVLRQTLTTKDYKPECRTIHSLLGLTLQADGEVKVLASPDEEIDLSRYALVVVDEAGMINGQVMTHIDSALAAHSNLLFLFLGDAAQLPPVKELKSPVWSLKHSAALSTVMRHDNQILELATRMRKVVDHPAPSIKLETNNSDDEGVWVHPSPQQFCRQIIERSEMLRKPDRAKVIAWRNVTVDEYNKQIRRRIFGPEEAAKPWLYEDRVLFTAPARTLDDEPMASTDDEGTVTNVQESWHPLAADFKIYNVAIMLDDNRPVTARVLHEDSVGAYQSRVELMAQEARANSRKWKAFWEFKDLFHGLRHGYAITAHRAQGSTYDVAFVDWRDILLNRNRQEAFRCLYVACTRAKKELHLG